MRAVARGCLVGAFVAIAASGARAQEPKSAAAAKALVAALEAAKLDSIAARDPSSAGMYIGALYIPGSQLLVICGQYSAPLFLDARIAKKEYRDVYIDLNSASAVDSRIFIEDLGANGVYAQREDNQPFDSVNMTGKRTMFDGDWKKQKISETDYMSTFTQIDDRYARMLSALLEQIKKGS